MRGIIPVVWEAISPRGLDLVKGKTLKISVRDSFKDRVGHESLITHCASSAWARRQRRHLALVVLGLFF